jgi:replication initiator protein RepSA/NUDIX domain-containing protein
MPALALGPVLIDPGTKAGANTSSLEAELLERASRDDYQRWLGTALAAGGCVRPIRLRGTVRDIDATTGEILHDLDTEDLPDKAIYLPCGDRRASVCPPCAETYRADTYQLIRAGLAGGKGMPESVATHPCVFATFTAPSFGPVHTRLTTVNGKVARCRPRRKANYCPHGRRLSCGQRHKETDACLGRPQCAEREVKEETGLTVEAYHLVGVYSDPDHVFAYGDGEVRQEFSLCFACRILGGNIAKCLFLNPGEAAVCDL